MNGDYSKLLTDLALIGHRNKPVRVLFFKSRTDTGRKPAKPPYADALCAVLAKALDERLARKLTRKQYRTIRQRANNAIRNAA
jgi:hypothetical protein